MTRAIEFSIDKKIFATFPDYRRAIIIVSDVDNSKLSALGNDIVTAAQFLRTNVTLEDRRISAWRDAFVVYGMKLRDFKPSIDALVRRIHNDKPLGSINPIVDIGTLISLQFVLPAGAHPILDGTKTVRLKLAEGTEAEVSVGAHLDETIQPGEPILVDSGRVATRRWVWRQTSLSRIDATTRNFYLNLDALHVIDDATLEQAIEQSKITIRSLFNTAGLVIILSAINPRQTIKIND